eukprot:Hpha_TRINITY_DN16147_c1_g2::TRINITY_DN16147_c1_g2_i2::g.6139::m.6139
MAPEAASGSAEMASDIWALGLVVGELFAGFVPYSQDPPETRWSLEMAISPISTGTLLPEVPETATGLAAPFLQACWRRDTTQRPTAAQLLADPFVDLCQSDDPGSTGVADLLRQFSDTSADMALPLGLPRITTANSMQVPDAGFATDLTGAVKRESLWSDWIRQCGQEAKMFPGRPRNSALVQASRQTSPGTSPFQPRSAQSPTSPVLPRWPPRVQSPPPAPAGSKP